MPAPETIAIVCVCDNHYAVLLAALIQSIEHNHHTDEPLAFYIVDDHISARNKARIDRSISSEKTHIYWQPIERCIPDHMSLPNDKSSMPKNIYIRLFIPSFVPPETKRIIYLDVDMIMLKDISTLWHQDLMGYPIAAVQDQWLQVFNHWGAISNYAELNLSPTAPYFNAGLLVIDLGQWRSQQTTDRIIDCLNRNKEHVTFQDQYGLNLVFADNWLQLDPLWNRFASSEDKEPYLIHFTGRKPIYKSYEFNEDYRRIFLQYLTLAGWPAFKLIGEPKRYLKKLRNLLSKVRLFPRSAV